LSLVISPADNPYRVEFAIATASSALSTGWATSPGRRGITDPVRCLAQQPDRGLDLEARERPSRCLHPRG
jgi:hypothetical protein